MGTVDGYTAQRMKQIEDAAIVSGAMSGTHLMLTRHDGTQVDAGVITGSGYTTEEIQDMISTFLQAGTGISLSYNDATGALTITNTGGVGGGATLEEVMDLLGTTGLVAGTGISLSYNDAAGTLTITNTGGTGGGLDAEAVRDTIATALVEGSGINIVYDDTNDIITISEEGDDISALPAATTPLSGAEEIPMVQGGVTKKGSSAAIAALASGASGSLPAGIFDVTNLEEFGLTSLDPTGAVDSSPRLAALIAYVIAMQAGSLGSYATFIWPRANFVFRSPVEWGTAFVQNVGTGVPGGVYTWPQSATTLYCGANNMFIFKITAGSTVQQSSATFENMIFAGDGVHETEVGGIDVAGCNRVGLTNVAFFMLTWGVTFNEYAAPTTRGPYRGIYSSTTAYQVGDIVCEGPGAVEPVYPDHQFYCIQAGTGHDPQSSSAYWTASPYRDCAWHTLVNVQCDLIMGVGVFSIRSNSWWWHGGYLGNCQVGFDGPIFNSLKISGIKINAPWSIGMRLGCALNPGAHASAIDASIELGGAFPTVTYVSGANGATVTVSGSPAGAGFPSVGFATIMGSTIGLFSYTGLTSNGFTGCTTIITTVAPSGDVRMLPACTYSSGANTATVTATGSTQGFPKQGVCRIPGATIGVFSYTGLSGNTFTGCKTIVSAVSPSGTIVPQRVGIQVRGDAGQNSSGTGLKLDLTTLHLGNAAADPTYGILFDDMAHHNMYTIAWSASNIDNDHIAHDDNNSNICLASYWVVKPANTQTWS